MVVDDERPLRISNFETCESTAVWGRYRRCYSGVMVHVLAQSVGSSPLRAPMAKVLPPSVAATPAIARSRQLTTGCLVSGAAPG